MMSEITPGTWTVIDRTAVGEGYAILSDHAFPTKSGKTYQKYVAKFLSLEDATALANVPELIRAAVAAEREACARIAETYKSRVPAAEISAAIRARGVE
jgi:hypothetical protein